jgi:hypothetical protein
MEEQCNLFLTFSLHHSIIHKCDKRLISLLIDYKRLQDQSKSHAVDALNDKFRGKNCDKGVPGRHSGHRPIKQSVFKV